MSNKQNPYWPLKILRWFCPPHLLEEIEGDLLQRFECDAKLYGERPEILMKNKFHLNLITMLMLRNNFVMTFRQIRKDKVFSTINIFGLSVSMAACLLIFQYSFFELSYDKQLPEINNLFRVATVTIEDDQVKYQSAISSSQVGPALKQYFPEVMETARLISTRSWFDCTLAYVNNGDITIFNEKDNVYFADPSVTSLFNYQFIQGNKSTALEEPFSIVLSASTAKKYFGDGSPLGKTLNLNGSFQNHDYTVAGVIADPPVNSHIDVRILASINSLHRQPGADNFDAFTYVQVTKGIDIELLTSKIREHSIRLIPIVNKTRTEFALHPVADIHLYSSLQDEVKPTGNFRSVYFLLLVAIVVLVMAWINYINLTTAKAVSRAKEVGIRKVTGATRFQISFQFLTETLVLNLIGSAIAVLLVLFFAPYFYEFIGLSIPVKHLFQWSTNGTIFLAPLAFLVCILLVGFFPAQILSSFNPVKVLKGKWLDSKSGVSFRKATVVFQFACAIVLTISVVIFNRQFLFMKQQDLGVDINRSIVLKAPSNVDSTYLNKLSGFKDQLKSLAIVHSISTSTSVPGQLIDWTGEVRKEKDESSTGFSIHVIDPDFIDSYKLQLLSGRNFENNDFPGNHFGNKTEPVILNWTGVKRLGYEKADDVIGELIYWNTNKCRVVGVIDDFHQESLKKRFNLLCSRQTWGRL